MGFDFASMYFKEPVRSFRYPERRDCGTIDTRQSIRVGSYVTWLVVHIEFCV